MTRRLIFGGLVALGLMGCEPTTYGQAVQQQKRETNLERQLNAPGEPTATECPTIAASGSRDYTRCEGELRQATGGSGE